MKITIEALRIMVPFMASTAAFLSGYEVARRTGLSNGTSYGILHKLSADGMLRMKRETRNDKHGLPPRIFYSITPEGQQKAKAVLDLLRVST
jgi:DNA-binding PadR family transcriptional regulator